MAINAYSLARDGETYLSKNFQVHEFYCRDGSDPIFVDSDLTLRSACVADRNSTALLSTVL